MNSLIFKKMANKRSRFSEEDMNFIMFLGVIFSTAMILMLHFGYFLLSLIMLIGAVLTWMKDNELNNIIMATIFLAGGFLEMFIFSNFIIGFVLLILSFIVFFIPKKEMHI